MYVFSPPVKGIETDVTVVRHIWMRRNSVVKSVDSYSNNQALIGPSRGLTFL